MFPLENLYWRTRIRQYINFLQLKEYKESDSSDDSDNEEMETEQLEAKDEGIFCSSLNIHILIDSNNIANHLMYGQILYVEW